MKTGSPELDQPCLAARHVVSYLLAVFLIACALTFVIYRMLAFERFGPVPLFSPLGMRKFFELFAGLAGGGVLLVFPGTKFLLAREWRGWVAFALAGVVYAIVATVFGGVALFSAAMGALDDLVVLALISAALSVIFVPANLVYWALAIHPATLSLWQRICKHREGAGEGPGS